MDFPDQSQCSNTEIASLLDLTPKCLLSRQASEKLNSLYTESPGFFRPAIWVKHMEVRSCRPDITVILWKQHIETQDSLYSGFRVVTLIYTGLNLIQHNCKTVWKYNAMVFNAFCACRTSPTTFTNLFLILSFKNNKHVNYSSSLFDEMYYIAAPSINMIPKFLNYKS